MTPEIRLPNDAAATALLRTVLAGIADGITAQDPSGRLVYANDAAARALGFSSAEEFMQTPVPTFLESYEIYRDTGERITFADLPGRRALAGESDPELIIWYRHVGSSERRWSHIKARAIHDEAGSIVLAVNIWQDITAQMEQHERIERAEARAQFLSELGRVLATSSIDYEETLRAVARMLVPTLADWCTIHLVDDNEQVRRLEVAHADPAKVAFVQELEKKYPPRKSEVMYEVLGTGAPAFFPDISDEMLAGSAQSEEHARILIDLEIRSVMMVPLIARDRRLGVITLIAGESGRRFTQDDLMFAEEIGHRAGIAVDNARLYMEARESSRVKSDFLATMSHELRTPLNAIIGYTDLLALGVDGPLSQMQEERLERIRAASRHLIQIIDEILTFSRLEADKETVRLAPAEVCALARSAADLMLPAVQHSGLQLHLSLPEHERTASLDAPKVRQILLNLLSNAVKFTPSGEVRLRASWTNDEVVYEVSDTGVGIAAEHLERVFEPFWQVTPGSTRQASGTGLGLSVSRRLARLMGGDLTAESAPGAGARFVLRIPV